jgi:3alpha(or 20beta)-hydroxysteroid dehydrogenase
MGRLDGKVALISGGSKNQGAAEAKLFTAEGAKVVFGDIADEEGRAFEAEIKAAGREADYTHLDVASAADWQAAVAHASERFGELDILINNAAILKPRVPVEERTEEKWDRVMSFNAKGVFLGTKTAILAMRNAGGGSIVNISSISGIGQTLTQKPAYAASKGAIRVFSKVVATQHAKDKIGYNSVHSGPVDTAMFRAAFPTPEVMDERLSRVPMKRAGSIDEVVQGVLFLASN